MVEAVVDFVRKKHSKSVRIVKILIFQTVMMMEFHKSMKRREGEQVEEKSIFAKVKGIFFSSKLCLLWMCHRFLSFILVHFDQDCSKE